MKIKKIGNIYGYDGGNYGGNVYDETGLSPTITDTSGGGEQAAYGLR